MTIAKQIEAAASGLPEVEKARTAAERLATLQNDLNRLERAIADAEEQRADLAEISHQRAEIAAQCVLGERSASELSAFDKSPVGKRLSDAITIGPMLANLESRRDRLQAEIESAGRTAKATRNAALLAIAERIGTHYARAAGEASRLGAALQFLSFDGPDFYTPTNYSARGLPKFILHSCERETETANQLLFGDSSARGNLRAELDAAIASMGL